ncbi:MAG: SDR family NAD(P)-dependent oxidoreductase, partial [Alphaproteobacteria bacterium]
MSRVLIVTGGSRGLGAATCIGAAEAGYEAICVNYVGNKARADEVVAACEKAGAKAIAVQADVTKEADIVRMFETVDKELGTVTHVVNSAGIVGPYARVDELDDWSALEELWTLNITATLICSREAIKRMSTKHGGKGGAIVH